MWIDWFQIRCLQSFSTMQHDKPTLEVLLFNCIFFWYWHRYFIERGLLPSAEPLLDIARNICETCLEDPDLILADIYGAYGGIDSQRNQLEPTLENFETQHFYLRHAFRKKLLERPNVREALAFGRLSQGYAGLNNYYKAEIYFNKCIEAWSDCPGAHYISIPSWHLFGISREIWSRWRDTRYYPIQIIDQAKKAFKYLRANFGAYSSWYLLL